MKCRQGIVEEDEGLSEKSDQVERAEVFFGGTSRATCISSAVVLGVAREEGLATFSRPREFVTNGTLTTDRPWSAPLALSPGCARWTWPSSPSAPRALLDSSALPNGAMRSWTGPRHTCGTRSWCCTWMITPRLRSAVSASLIGDLPDHSW